MKKSDGFTIIELMIFIGMVSIVMVTAYAVFKAQQKSYKNQEAIVDTQENLRAGSFYVINEIRQAGYCYDPGIKMASPGVFNIAMDIWDPGDVDGDGYTNIDSDGHIDQPGEEVIYALSDDADGDGFPDTLTAQGTPKPAILTRTDVYGTNQPETVMEHVEAVSFAYAFDVDTDMDQLVDRSGGEIIWAVDSDGDGDLDTILDTNFDGVIDINDAEGGAPIPLPTEVNIDRIRMVQIWMLVRSPVQDPQHVSQNTYVIGEKRLAVNDGYRRRVLTAAINCRNMGD